MEIRCSRLPLRPQRCFPLGFIAWGSIRHRRVLGGGCHSQLLCERGDRAMSPAETCPAGVVLPAVLGDGGVLGTTLTWCRVGTPAWSCPGLHTASELWRGCSVPLAPAASRGLGSRIVLAAFVGTTFATHPRAPHYLTHPGSQGDAGKTSLLLQALCLAERPEKAA